MARFHCNLAQTEINFTNSEGKRITVKFHFNYFETDDKETIAFLSKYQSQGVLVSIAGTQPIVEEHIEEEQPEPIVRIKSTASTGKR